MRRALRVLPAVLLAAAAPSLPALPPDAFRLGVQVLGQNLVGISAEWVFSQNGLGLEAGIFDAIDEPVLTAFYRRYFAIPGLSNAGLAPSIGAELIVMANLPSLWSGSPAVGGAAGATIGLDWTFLERFSLALELHGVLGMNLAAGGIEPALSPSLSARISF